MKVTILGDMPTELLSTAKAASQLNIHRSTLTRMVQAGKIRAAVKGEGLRGEMFFYPSEIRKAQARMVAERSVVTAREEAAS